MNNPWHATVLKFFLACLTNLYPTYSVEETPVHVCGEEGLQGIHDCFPRGSKEHTRLSWTWRGSNVENIFVSVNYSEHRFGQVQ